MLFLCDVLRSVRNVSVYADANNISDSEFKIYKSNLLEGFPSLESLQLSFAKNSLSVASFASKWVALNECVVNLSSND